MCFFPPLCGNSTFLEEKEKTKYHLDLFLFWNFYFQKKKEEKNFCEWRSHRWQFIPSQVQSVERRLCRECK